jgi:hypothetical protein
VARAVTMRKCCFSSSDSADPLFLMNCTHVCEGGQIR